MILYKSLYKHYNFISTDLKKCSLAHMQLEEEASNNNYLFMNNHLYLYFGDAKNVLLINLMINLFSEYINCNVIF